MKEVRVIATISFTVEGENDDEIFYYAQDRIEEMTHCVRECKKVETDFDLEDLD